MYNKDCNKSNIKQIVAIGKIELSRSLCWKGPYHFSTVDLAVYIYKFLILDYDPPRRNPAYAPLSLEKGREYRV